MPKRDVRSATTRCETCLLCDGERGFTIKSESANLAIIRDKIRRIGEHCRFSEKQLFDLQVAVGEATANAIEHGSPLGRKNNVDVVAACDGESLTVTIKDEGQFKRNLPFPTSEEISLRGRGIPLMLALMDRVTIDEAKNGTSVVLVKQLRNGDCRGDVSFGT